MAAIGTGAAAGENRRAVGPGHARNPRPMVSRTGAATARTRLDRWAQHYGRVSLGGGKQRALHRNRGRVRPTQGRCHCNVGNRTDAGSKTGHTEYPGRLCGHSRCRRQRRRREPGATGRQPHRAFSSVHRSCRQAPRTLARDSSQSPSIGDPDQCRQSRRHAGGA